MEDASSSRPAWLRIEDPRAARALSDAASLRFLEPFLARERSVAQAAEEIGASMSSVLYRVRQFLRLGLLEQTRVRPRKGRAIRSYRTVADGFFVPFQHTAVSSQESLAAHAFRQSRERLDRSVGRAWTQAFGEQHSLGIQIFRRPEGRFSQNIAPDPMQPAGARALGPLLEPDSPAVWDSWGAIRLRQEDAKALQQELASLLQRYREAPPGKGQVHLVHLAIAPLG